MAAFDRYKAAVYEADAMMFELLLFCRSTRTTAIEKYGSVWTIPEFLLTPFDDFEHASSWLRIQGNFYGKLIDVERSEYRNYSSAQGSLIKLHQCDFGNGMSPAYEKLTAIHELSHVIGAFTHGPKFRAAYQRVLTDIADVSFANLYSVMLLEAEERVMQRAN